MHFQWLVAGTFLSLLFPVSATFAAGKSVDAGLVEVDFPNDQATALQIGSADAREVRLVIDFVGILYIEGGMNTIAVGNSDIAIASLADDRTVILTGRMPGTTNLIALDDAGRVIADVVVRVSSQKPGMVTVRRGMQMQAYDCGSGLCKGGENESLVAAAVPLAAATTK